jgi:hypothetical protein
MVVASCGGNARSSGVAAGRAGLAALPNSSAVYHADGELLGLSPGGAPTWKVKLPGQATIIARLAVAPNSTLYARSHRGLHAIDHKGNLLWSVTLPEPGPQMGRDALAPVALTNSTVVVLESPRRLKAFGLDGTELWGVDVPSGVPQGPLVVCRNGQLLVTTTSSVHAYSGHGELAWTYVPAVAAP